MKISKGSGRARGYVFVLVVAAALAVSPLARADIFSPDGFSAGPGNDDVNASHDVFSSLVVISERELGAMRGGFRVGGLDIGIGTNVRTLFDGRLAFESNIKLTGNGPVTRSLASPAVALGSPGLTVITGDGSGPSLRDATAGRIELPGLEGSQGVILNDDRGLTAALSQITSDGFLSVLLNQASGRSVRHEVNIDVTVRNFSNFQQAVRSATLANRFSAIR